MKKTAKIGYILFDDEGKPEHSAAIDWLKTLRKYSTESFTLNSPSRNKEFKKYDLIWVNCLKEAEYEHLKAKDGFLQLLKDYYSDGGNLLLTNYAACLPYDLGIESVSPEKKALEIKDRGFGRKYGFQSFRGHPLFKGLHDGAYIINKHEDTIENRIGYFENNFPSEGRVAAVEKAYVMQYPQNRLVIEYSQKSSMILSIGAFIDLHCENFQQKSLKIFLENTIDYLITKKSKKAAAYWEKASNRPHEFAVSGTKSVKFYQKRINFNNNSGLFLHHEKAGYDFFDLAGRRCLLMGRENGGIDEIWIYPFRIIRDLQCGIVSNGKITWLNGRKPSIEIRPESVTRTYELPAFKMKETILVSKNSPGGCIHYESLSGQPIKLFLKFRTDLRYMWPYDSGALGDMFYSFDKKTSALHIRDKSEDFYSLFGGNSKPEKAIAGQYKNIVLDNSGLTGQVTDENQIYAGFVFDLNKDNEYCLNFSFAGSNRGKEEAENSYKTLSEDPGNEYNKTVMHYKNLLKYGTVIDSPDEEFNEGYKWALIATDRFFINTPGLGRGFVAGYGNSDSGWDGGQKTSGRPGYGWYFGRDAAWSCFAVNSYGDFNAVKDQLELFRKYQDHSGKIFHELSASGAVHYDAADATPLYIILAADYLRSSGDEKFIRELMPSIKLAMDFLYTTDRDGDDLIENSVEGHGWIEGGPLYGAKVTLYLAGLWARALHDASYLESVYGNTAKSLRFSEEALNVQKTIEERFWNPGTGFYNYGLKPDSTYESEKTVLPAVLMFFNLLDFNRTAKMLNEFSGSGFSTDWGVRILRSDSKNYNPEGYHSGSVWPLYTGWTALAEYEYGRSYSGYTHIMNNLKIYKNWASGLVEEVLHGDEYRPSGVCPHQCWSETNILHPAISGMIGFKPDVPNSIIKLSPRFPLNWGSVNVRNIRAGSSLINLRKTCSKNETVYDFQLTGGPEILVEFSPEIPAGMIITGCEINGKPLGKNGRNARGLLSEPLNFKLNGRTQIKINHKNGIGLIPAVPDPVPGSRSVQMRVINYELKDNIFTVKVECHPDGENILKVKTFDQQLEVIEGAQILSSDKGIHSLKIDRKSSKKGYVPSKIILKLKSD